MRAFAAAAGLCLVVALAIGQPMAQPAENPPERPRVYVLLAALGDQFSVVSEVSRTGTHLSPYQRRTSQVPGDALNRLALHSLDEAVASIDPKSRRIYLAAPALAMDRVAPSEREAVAIAAIKHALEGMPQRAEWDRIVVATPAYRALELNGLGTRLQGFGLFEQTQCQAACGGFSSEEQARAIAREPPEKPLDTSQPEAQKYLLRRIAGLIDLSIGEAILRSDANARRGMVDVGPFKEVKPDGEPTK